MDRFTIAEIGPDPGIVIVDVGALQLHGPLGQVARRKVESILVGRHAQAILGPIPRVDMVDVADPALLVQNKVQHNTIGQIRHPEDNLPWIGRSPHSQGNLRVGNCDSNAVCDRLGKGPVRSHSIAKCRDAPPFVRSDVDTVKFFASVRVEEHWHDGAFILAMDLGTAAAVDLEQDDVSAFFFDALWFHRTSGSAASGPPAGSAGAAIS